MSFSELFLRLGCSLTAWIVVFAHCVWLAALQQVDCTTTGTQPWVALLGFSVITIGLAALLPVGATVPGVAGMLRLPGVLLLLLIPFAFRHVAFVFERATLNNRGICVDGIAAGWERWWAPVQTVVLVVIVVSAIVLWRRTSKALKAAEASR